MKQQTRTKRKELSLKTQIHIGGAKRSGKTTLARKLAWRLLRRNFTVALFDIDDVRRELFGQADIDAPIGSDDNKRMYAAAHEYLFKDAIPQAIRSGAIPIMVATHSRRELYDRAFEVSEKCRATLKFVLLEPPSIEETIRRAESDTTSVSDTKNLAGDSDERVSTFYGAVFGKLQRKNWQLYLDTAG